jgi:hypothetical protein
MLFVQKILATVCIVAMGTLIPSTGSLIDDIQRFGFFVNLRILPRHNFGPYLDPQHPKYPSPVDFQVLYEALLKTYDQIYPIASIITPFTESYFNKGHKFLQQRLSPQNWASATYMPSSRDMSEDQWALFLAWMANMQQP